MVLAVMDPSRYSLLILYFGLETESVTVLDMLYSVRKNLMQGHLFRNIEVIKKKTPADTFMSLGLYQVYWT